MKSIVLYKKFLLCILISVAGQLPTVAQTDTSFDRQKMNAYLNTLEQEQKFN
jgi:hypothetical protein